jgi:hypothetical protein
MLSSIKTAQERQANINNQKISSNTITPNQTAMMINHFERVLKNWTEINNVSGDKDISIPIINEINKSKYEEWKSIFENAGYDVKIDKFKFTVSMKTV